MRAHPLAGIIAGAARLISGVNVRWADSEPDPRQTVYFANHSSHLDFVVLWSALPAEIRARTRPVAAQDYWEKGLRRAIAVNIFRAVLVARRQVGAELSLASSNPQEAIENMVAAMGSDYSLIIFPEGTRGTGEEVGAFKSGLYYLAKAETGATAGSRLPQQSESHTAEGRIPACAIYQPANIRSSPHARSGGAEACIPDPGTRCAVPVA